MSLIHILPHAAYVHMPMAIAVLLPAIYASTWWAVSRGVMPGRTWYGVLALVGVQVVSLCLSVISGYGAEADSGAKYDWLRHHREFGEAFLALWIALAAVMGWAWWFRRAPWAALAHSLTMAMLVGQLIMAFYVGHAGGLLLQ